jgi:hypothetical protein
MNQPAAFPWRAQANRVSANKSRAMRGSSIMTASLFAILCFPFYRAIESCVENNR